MRATRDTRHATTGYTLMEVMIVMVVVAIMAAVAIPNYQRAVEQGSWRSANNVLQTSMRGSATRDRP